MTVIQVSLCWLTLKDVVGATALVDSIYCTRDLDDGEYVNISCSAK